MTIALFGSTGQLGRCVLHELLQEGHRVRVLVRSSLKLTEILPEIDVVEGDMKDRAKVEDTLKGVDAVVSTLGIADVSHPTTELSDALKGIIEEMKDRDLKRIITVGGSGILPHPEGGLQRDHDFPEFLRHITDEHFREWEALQASGLDWTLMCPAFFTEQRATKAFRVAREAMPPGSQNIDINSLAAFIVEELVDGRYIGCRVGIVSDNLDDE